MIINDLFSIKYDDLADLMAGLGEMRYRADQVFFGIHRKGARSIDEIPVIPNALREKLRGVLTVPEFALHEKLESKIDGTVKFAFMSGGQIIESVLMQYSYGQSLCISSQAGCRMGCAFCVTGISGLSRDLAPSEMIRQLYDAERESGKRISRIVIMGMGEPMDNLKNVMDFLRIVTHKKGRDMSPRDITISTCGLVPQIRRLANAGLPVNLALSLHAADDAKRRELMPAASAYTIKECMAACDYYFEKTGRRITYEYALFKGINDGDDDMALLAALLYGRNCHVNLIRANTVPGTGLCPAGRERTRRFMQGLRGHGINVTQRRSLGADISGACGQLRLKRGNLRTNDIFDNIQ